MSHVTKLSLAVGLALAAAALNAMWLTAEKRPPTFVAASMDVKAGETITDAMLTDVPVPGNPDKLRKSLIPYGNRALLLGRKAPRNYARKATCSFSATSGPARTGPVRNAWTVSADRRRRTV